MDEEFLQSLTKLRIPVYKKVKTAVFGQENTKNKSGAEDFLGHRAYSRDDEYRYIDWNIYARTEQLFVKEMSRTESPKIFLLLDNSKSMYTPENKIDMAKKLLFALWFIAIKNSIPVLCRVLFSDEPIIRSSSSSSFQFIQKYLEQVKPANETLQHGLKIIKGSQLSVSLTVLISDFWYSSLEIKSLIDLLKISQDMCFIQVLSPHELEWNLTGQLLFVDAETSNSYQNYITKEEIDKYRALVQEHIQMIKDICYAHAIRYALVLSNTAIEEAIFIKLRQADIVCATKTG